MPDQQPPVPNLTVTVKPIFQFLFVLIFLLGITATASSSPRGDNTFKRIQSGSYEVKNGSIPIYTSKFRPDFSVVFVYMSSSDTKEDFGPRFVLLKKKGKRFAVLDQSRGMRENHLDPTVFESKNRIVILANITGNHDSYGVVVYEIENEKLKSLGAINVAKPSGAYTINPIPDAVVKSNKDKLVIEFHTDLVLDSTVYYKEWMDGLGWRRWPKKRVNGQPFVFEYDDKQFQLKNNK